MFFYFFHGSISRAENTRLLLLTVYASIHQTTTTPAIPRQQSKRAHTRRASLSRSFYLASKERGERHRGYDPPGAEEFADEERS